MNHRSVALVDNKALTADNVEIYNLKGLDPISELIVRYRGLNASSTPTEHPATLITRIQVVDGSEVIMDLSGKQAVALAYYHYKQVTPQILNYIDNNYCGVTCRIPFGRYLWDPELALDPVRFKNLQVIVTTDLNGGGGAPDAGILEIAANIFDGKKINPRGYLKAREHYKYSVVASGEHTIDLPVDRIIKMIMLQGDYKDTSLSQQINKIKITEDNDKKVPWNNNTVDILQMLAATLPAWQEKIRFNGTTSAVEFFITQFYEAAAVLGGIMATPNYGSATQSDGGTMDIDMSAAGECDGLTFGWAPHGCIGLECGDEWDVEDWFNPTGVHELKAKLTAGSSASSSGTNKVVVQQLMGY